MKIKYLTADDRRTLRLLHHTSDAELIASVLASVFRRKYTLQVLWEYRKWFLELPREYYMKDMSLIYGLTQIYIMSGELLKAKEVVELLPEGSMERVVSEIMLPTTDNDKMFELADIMIKNGWVSDYIPLTAGRPSVMNGLWDLSPSIERFKENKKNMIKTIDAIFKDGHDAIYDIILAEAMYQRDDCYGALVNIVSKTPYLREQRDMRVLFAALTQEIYILILNGQAETAEPLMENLRKQIVKNELEEYVPNVEALEIWAAMYDGNYTKIIEWLKNGAPDEQNRFCTLDTFRYMIKMRVYIVLGKYMLVTMLGNKLLGLFEPSHRHMDKCELHLLLAMSSHAAGEEDMALDHAEKMIEISRVYRFDRLIADEGSRALAVLRLYKKERGSDEYVDRLIKLAEKVAQIHPEYLKNRPDEMPAITRTEKKVLRYLEEEYTNAQIAEQLDIAVDTVKQHCKHICRKLDVKNRHQAVRRAKELGII